MYGAIRIIFFGTIFAICIFVLKSKKRLKKKNVIITAIIAILLCELSTMFPVESYFFTFSTPQKAFNYINREKVVLVVDGDESVWVIGEKAKAQYTSMVVPKCINGYKLGRGIDTKLKKQIIDNNIVICLYQYKDNGDYYISVLDTSDKTPGITDKCNSLFVSFSEENANLHAFSFFAHITQYDNDYWIKVNGKKYVFKEQ